MHVEQHGEYSSAAAAYHIPGRRPLSMSAANPYVCWVVLYLSKIPSDSCVHSLNLLQLYLPVWIFPGASLVLSPYTRLNGIKMFFRGLGNLRLFLGRWVVTPFEPHGRIRFQVE